MSHPPLRSRTITSTTLSRIELPFDFLVFGSRSIQAPLYGDLIIAELLYASKFLLELWEMGIHVNELEETKFMLSVLGKMIHVTMVANLLTIVISEVMHIVSKLDSKHPERPEWFTHVEPGIMRI